MKSLKDLIVGRKRESFLLMGFALMPMLLGSALVLEVVGHHQLISKFTMTEWFLVFVLLSIPIAFSLIANTLAGLLAGYFLGWLGLPFMALSFSLACMLGYAIGRLFGSGLKDDIIAIWPAAKGLLDRLGDKPFSLVFTLRLLPAPPFAIGTLFLSWLRVPFPSFMAASFLGMIPRMAIVVWFGSITGDVVAMVHNPMEDLRLKIAFGLIAGVGLLFFYFKFMYNRSKS
jgi:uncharacterized membrane protein YdjX (TVP38/TMEM64 family)